MKTFIQYRRSLGVLLAAALSLAAPSHAGIGEGESPEFLLNLCYGHGCAGVGQGSAESGAFALDLRGVTGPTLRGHWAESGLFTINLLGLQGGLAVSGGVFDATTGAGISGALVTIGSTTATTDAQGGYRFASIAVGTYAFSISKSGYNSHEGTLVVPAGASLRRDMSLAPLSQTGSAPRVTGITCPYPGFLYFLDGPEFNVTFTATVDWAGHAPSKVEFRTPQGIREVATSGTTASRTFNMGADFGPKGKLRVVAVSSDGARSAERMAEFIVTPVPSPEVAGALLGVSRGLGGSGFRYNTEIGFNLSFFEEAVGAGLIPEDIPIFGKEGVNLQFIPQMTCEIGSDGLASFKFKWSDMKAGEVLEKEWGREHNLKKIIELLTDQTEKGLVDKRRLPKAGMAGLELHWYPIAGGQFQFDRPSEQWKPVRFGVGLAGAFEIHKSWPFIFMAGPVPVPTYAKVGLEVEAEAQLQVLSLEPISLNGSLALDPYVRGSLGVGVDEVLAIEGWIGGGLDLDLQYPAEPRFDVSLYLNGGATVYFLLWTWDNEFLYWEWPEEKAARSRLFSPLAMVSSGPTLLSRDYLKQGDYGWFFGSQTKAARAAGLAALSPKSSPLQTTIFPYSEPDCSSTGTNFHLVWLNDDPTRSAMNRTVAQFSRFDGTTWSEPIPVADDGTADFHPKILTFGDGWSVCAWENEQVALPDTATLDDMKAGLEISVAWYDAAANRWQTPQPAATSEGARTILSAPSRVDAADQADRSADNPVRTDTPNDPNADRIVRAPVRAPLDAPVGAPVMLTTNSWLDRSPKLAGHSRDNVLLVWTANASNHITGTEREPNQLLFSRWKGTDWSGPEVFLTVPYPLVKYDLAYDGTNGHLVMSLDTSNTHTNVAARELFRVAYQSGAWGALERLTDDQVPDDNPLLALDENGRSVLVWLKDTEISSVVDFSMTNRQVVRTNLYSSNLGDAKLARGSDGKLALVWAEPSNFSSDLHAVFYDPVFRLWGQPKQLTSDAETERSLTTAFRGTDQLMAVYNRRLIGPTNSGASADLYVLQYGLGEDLALNFFDSSPLNPGPGETATFQATVVNLGDKVAADVPVAFYLGEPGSGGVEIGRIPLPQPLAPGEKIDITYGWTLPQTNQLVAVYALVDPDQVLADLVRSNNILALELGKADLAVESVTWSQIASNTLSVAARVGNHGVVTGQTATVEFRLGSPTGTILLSQSVTHLAPGEASEVTFLWDVSGLESALDIYVVLTGLDAGSDFDLGNNTVRLAVQRVAGPSPLSLGPLVSLPGGVFQLMVWGEAGRSYGIETSTNLLDWEPFAEFFSTNSSMPVIDSSGNQLPRKFYRAVAE